MLHGVTAFVDPRTHGLQHPCLRQFSCTAESCHHEQDLNIRTTKIAEGSEKGSATNSAQHPAGHLTIGSCPLFLRPLVPEQATFGVR